MAAAAKLALITTSLGYADGGAASLSRLVAQSTAAYCREKALDFEVLNLGVPTDILAGIHVKHFSQNQQALALAVWQRALIERRTAFIFMHVGLARTMALMPEFLRPRYMLWLLGVEVWGQLNWQRRKAVENATIRIALSAFTAKRTREIHPWLPQTQVLHLALEKQTVDDELDRDLLQAAGEDFMLIVGRMSSQERYKGHDELLSVIPRLVTKLPHARLVVVGNGDDQPRLATLTMENGVQDNVFFTGFVSEATRQELLHRCRLFVMPSRNEGFGLVFLEAMKAGKPCVALRDTAPAEIIEDGVTGLLVNPGDLDELEEALLKLLRDDALAKRMGEAGQKRLADVFSEALFDKKLHQVLDRLLKR